MDRISVCGHGGAYRSIYEKVDPDSSEKDAANEHPHLGKLSVGSVARGIQPQVIAALAIFSQRDC